ncbi:GNAT family N-acetyltransferase [Phytoactinopolyspora halotolerans]|uniref:GNAT family N-acetyltransferase n=1 Tax=Phytoactinopolyspora halotolerans TaxID=1981512 RepID=A0A6L9SE73_9ACTN|nr:GNAT family N-acetyltransferase [Phytoactinopolyspora halotolerans]NEE02801.1 GNAT family N-acetyltransferase [Phytoactinopolyspora halotolerans]
MSVTVTSEPLHEDVQDLIAGLNEHLLPLSPIEFQFRMTAEQMAEPDTTVFIARDLHGNAVGCGALKIHTDTLGEVKRMFTRPEARGNGVGSALLDAIVTRARDQRLSWLMLETGVGPGFADAGRLYQSRGFTARGPFLDYPDSGWSAFYELHLSH